MGFGGIGEMMFILVLGLLLFGPKRLPEIARQVGKVLGELRKASAEFQTQLNDEVRRLEASVQEEESNRSIAPPALQDSTPRNETPQYALEPNSGQHEGEVLSPSTAFEAINGSQLSAENQASFIDESAVSVNNDANPVEGPEKIKE